ncbi:hypothetical protein CG399_02015 [Bifidobacteriaceae bacterium NR015]|nr:hypothetical protein CG399_02015 [Bifidobacteriaceae bacterium NR015]
MLADKASNRLLARIVDTELFALGHIHANKAVVLVACIDERHAAHAMDGDDDAPNLRRWYRLGMSYLVLPFLG